MPLSNAAFPNLSRLTARRWGGERRDGFTWGTGVPAHAHTSFVWVVGAFMWVGLQAPVPTTQANGAANPRARCLCKWSCTWVKLHTYPPLAWPSSKWAMAQFQKGLSPGVGDPWSNGFWEHKVCASKEKRGSMPLKMLCWAWGSPFSAWDNPIQFYSRKKKWIQMEFK